MAERHRRGVRMMVDGLHIVTVEQVKHAPEAHRRTARLRGGLWKATPVSGTGEARIVYGDQIGTNHV